MMSIPHAVQGNVVDPHVEVRPVYAYEKDHASKRRMASGPRQNQANTDGDFHDAGDEDPDGRVAENRRDNRLKPGGVGEVLDANVDIHQTENSG